MLTGRRFVCLVLMAVMLAAVAPTASAAGPTGSWVSGIACVNTSTTTANITLKFYATGSGANPVTYSDTIPGSGSRNYYTPGAPLNERLQPGFQGSAVVESDQPIACNVNTQTSGDGSAANPYRTDTSKGFQDADTATTLYAPQVMKKLSGTWDSYIAVQNAGTSDATVTITYKDRNGNDVPAATQTATVPGQSNKVFYQADNGNLASGFLGSAKISGGSAKLAAIVAMYNAGTNANDSQFQTYNAVASGGSKLLVPRFNRNYYGYSSGMSIQNVGASATTFTITFTIGGRTYIYNSPSIPAGAAKALYGPDMAELAGVDSLAMGQRVGSAVIQAASGGSLVAIVNEDNRGGYAPFAAMTGQGATYNAVANGTQTTKVSFAQVVRRPQDFSGGFQVTNTTGTATTCNIAYAGAGGANESNVPLAGNGSFSRYAPTVANLPNGFNSSVTVTCGQPVIGISNMSATRDIGKVGDSFAQTTGTNQ